MNSRWGKKTNEKIVKEMTVRLDYIKILSSDN